ncbi:hypothetical protein JQR84_20710 (plasmid) [Pseudomonas luteola]|nr:hypothetical protein [Pseudomonas luteola]MBW5413552.1 hypothetical protein [Pseudomonas sp. MAG002Y]
MEPIPKAVPRMCTKQRCWYSSNHYKGAYAMVNPVNNPNTGFTGFVGDVTNAGGQFVQGANQAEANFSTQQAMNEMTGTSSSVEAQRAEMKKNDENNAALIGLQGQENRQIAIQNTLNSIQSARDDASNKKISSAAQNAKGISY